MPLKSQIREFVKGLTLLDDVLFRKAAEDLEFCQEFIETCLDDPRVVVLENLPQKEMLNLQGKSAIVDVLCRLGDGRISVVEVQKRNDVNHIKSARYDRALVTTNTTDPSGDKSNIIDVILIYVTKTDIFKKGVVKYFSKNTLLHFGDVLDDGELTIYINASVYDGSRLAKLMNVFKGKRDFRSEFPKIKNRLELFTEHEEGIEEMSILCEEIFSKELDRRVEEARKEALEEARKEARKEMLKTFAKQLETGYSKDELLSQIKEMLEQTSGTQEGGKV